MRHTRLHSHLVADFAAEHGIKLRAAQLHRKDGTERWRSWLASRAAGMVPVPCMVIPPDENGAGGMAEIVAADEVGLAAEVARLQSETLALAAEIATMQKSDVAGRMALMRMLDEKRKTLREYQRDLSSILSSIGDVVPAAAVVRYCNALRAVICSLPARISTLVPQDQSADLRARIQAEVDLVLENCASISISNQ